MQWRALVPELFSPPHCIATPLLCHRRNVRQTFIPCTLETLPWPKVRIVCACRWETFLDWLSESGLLTAKMQSRTPSDAAGTTTLDGLRAGDVGEPVSRDSIAADSLFSNSLLPQDAA